MSFTPESLAQIYFNGALTEEAQKTFDEWMEKDPSFSQKIVQELKVALGPMPGSLKFVEARLDARIESIWARHKPSFFRVLVQKHPRKVLGLLIALVLAWGLVRWGPEVQRALLSGLHLSKPMETTVPPVLAAPTLKKKANPRHLIPNDVSLGYVDHSLQIVIDSDKKQKVAITVLDLHGNIVSNVYQGPWMPGHHVITWNGKNALGALVLPGEYTVVVQANGQTTSGVIHFPDF